MQIHMKGHTQREGMVCDVRPYESNRLGWNCMDLPSGVRMTLLRIDEFAIMLPGAAWHFEIETVSLRCLNVVVYSGFTAERGLGDYRTTDFAG